VERLDLPRDPEHPDPDGYQAERRALKVDYRTRVVEGSGHLRHRFACTADLKAKVRDLRGHVEPWFEEIRRFNRQILEGQEAARREVAALAQQFSDLNTQKALAVPGTGWGLGHHLGRRFRPGRG
jgi:hypothetical protein